MYNSVSLLYWIHTVIETGKVSCSCRVIQLQNIDNCHNHYNKPGRYHFVGFYNHLLVEHLAALRICIGKRSHVLKFGYVWFAAHATITTLHVPLLLHSGIVCLSINSWWYTPSCESSPSHTSPKIAHPFGKANSCISHIALSLAATTTLSTHCVEARSSQTGAIIPGPFLGVVTQPTGEVAISRTTQRINLFTSTLYKSETTICQLNENGEPLLPEFRTSSGQQVCVSYIKLMMSLPILLQPLSDV